MRVFVDNYESAESREMTKEEFEELLYNFDREITLCDISSRVDYLNNCDPQCESLREILDTVDHSKTVVFHFDSCKDVYIEA